MTSPDVRTLLKNAFLRIDELETRLAASEAHSTAPIAVLGVGCRFPAGGTDPEAFWRALEAGVDGIRRIGPDRWPADALPADRPAARWAGLLDEVDRFDAQFFGISPREAAWLDPQQRLILEVASEALEHAGQDTGRLFGSKTGVFIGMISTDYSQMVREAGDFDMYSATGNAHSTAAGRIAYTLGLHGPCLTVDTACSSSLVAVHLACQSLRQNESTLAVVAGVNVILDPIGMAMLLETQAISPDGRCKTFDAEANGFVRGEGCGAVVLKRLADAERDGDPIVAVIRGSVVNQDGRSTGMTAPNVLSQQAMLRRALEVAGVQSADIGYIETHGTGTSLGDPIEFEALHDVIGAPRADGSTCVLGALKTNVGHMEAAAGVGGLIKAVLCLQHEAIPKNLHFNTLNPRMSIEGTPFVIPTETIPWKSNGKPRRAGVSSFGISGTNAHVILEEAPRREEKSIQAASSYLLPLSAKTPEALIALAKSYQEWFVTHDESLHHVAYSASVRRSHLEHRLGVVGSTREEIAAALGAFTAGEPPPGVATGKATQSAPKVVFVFPGQGSQWVGMGRQLYREEPAFREALDKCDAAIRKEAGFSVIEELDKPDETSQLSDIDVVQPVLFAIEVAIAALWRSWGIEPAAVVGHSMGEVAAAFVAGALSMDDAAAIICRRSRLLRKVSGQGAMALVELSFSDAEKALSGYESQLSVAVNNGPRSTVIAGDPGALDEVLGKLEKESVFCRRVKVDVASHSPQMDPLRDDLLAALNGVSPKAATVAMLSTVTSERIRGDELSATYWADNLRKPVLFSNVIKQWITDGHTIFLEMSPHPILTPSVEENLRESNAEGVALASVRRAQDERQTMLSSLAALHVRGVPVSWKAFFPEGGRVVDLPTYPWQRERYWIELPKRQTANTKSFVSASTANSANPLLGGSYTSSLNPEARFWRRSMSVSTIPWLSEHRVQEAVVFPGTGYVECALEAGAEALGGHHVLLEDVAFEQMMVFGEDQTRDVEVVLLDDGPRKSFRVSSQAENASWTRHASGHIRLLDKRSAEKSETPSTITSRLPNVIDVAAYYQSIRDRQAYHGPPFQGIVELRSSEREVLAKIRLSEDVDDAGYVIHPALLDACLQVSGALLSSSDSDTYVPVGIERLFLHKRPGREVWVIATKSSKDESMSDLRVIDEEGNVFVVIEGLCSQRIDRAVRATDPLANCVYEVVWREATPLGDPKLSSGGAWIIFADSGGVGDGLAERLSKLGQRCIRVVSGSSYEVMASNEIRIDHTKPDDYVRLFKETIGDEGRCSGVVFLSSLDVTPFEATTTESLSRDLTHASVSATYLAQAIVRHGFRDAPRLFLVTRGAQSVDSSDPISVSQAPILGLGKTITMEHPELRCTRIDLSAKADESDCDTLLREFGSKDREDQIALRGQSRYVGRLVHGKPLDTLNQPSVIRADRTYLITGGLGGLGLSLASWLVEQGARCIVLLGRHGPNDEAQTAIRMMEAAGARVHNVQADVSRAEDVGKTFSMIGGEMPPIGGIVHAAMVLDDKTLLEQSEASFQRVYAPKALGAWNLHECSQSLNLDFFVMYSSGAALMGSPGQGNYCASNAYLDALCRERTRRGLPAMSIQWGGFAEAGAAAALDIRGKRLSYRGGSSFSPGEGLEAFRRLLAHPRAEVGVMRFDLHQWVQFYPSTAGLPFWGELMKRDKGRERSDTQAKEFIARLQTVSSAERLSLLGKHLAEHIGAVLHIDTSRIDRTAPLQGLGMDSLMSLELRNRIEASLGLRLSATVLFKYSNIAALAPVLLTDLGIGSDPIVSTDKSVEMKPEKHFDRNVADMSEDEAEAMLLSKLASRRVLGKK